MVAMFLNNGAESTPSTKGDWKPTSYLYSTQKTLITAKKSQMGMVRLEICDHSQQFAEQTQEMQSHT